MSATFDVIPVIEQGLDGLQDTHEVQLALTPNARRMFMRHLCRQVLLANSTGKALHRDMVIAGAREIDETQQAALDRVEHTFWHALCEFTVSPEEATALGHALLEAAEPPQVCADCNHLIDTDTAGTSCARCTESPRGLRAS